MSVLKTPFHIVQAELGPGIVDNRGMALAQLYSPFSDVLHEASHLFKAAPDLLAACEATCATIEFRGKHALAVFDELAEDESNWRDGIEPYWLEVYDQAKAAIAKAKGEGEAER